MSKIKIIFDTDPGIDDAMALAFLGAHPQAELLALTTVFGNGGVDITTRNALYLTQRFGIDVPVYRGAHTPLVLPAPTPAPHVHGYDGLGDIGAVQGFEAAPQGVPAPQRIVELIREHPGEITLLAVGPLTNLALALDLDPQIAGLVKEVVIMGGAFGWGPRRGNVSPVAEANIINDPHAADQVFTAPWPIRAVGLDVTTQCILSTAAAEALGRTAGETGQFLFDISRGYEKLYTERDGFAGCALHDVAAAIAVFEPQLFGYARGTVRAVTDGIAIGQTILKEEGRNFPPGPWDDLPVQTVCREVDAAGVLGAYTAALSARYAGLKAAG
ncbi:nucleoside hydrolase [Asticcacaulis sp. AND118]|uniref:nucleoside hydrolase n=1 Tax=Asticcacaulis sp. AND118 TaxID=2840468 RepID=UPI001CFF964C|nr:nucleoside hydrolase [Asticcacaulis sp. AND118]UDF05331.1 nucleoside hydrolase [Asticcacaulis sp. AND118]